MLPSPGQPQNILLAVLLDDIFGEPVVLHPLTAFGKRAKSCEEFFHPGFAPGERQYLTNALGLAALISAVAPPVALVNSLVRIPLLGKIIDPVLLYLVIAPRSLAQHGKDVYDALSEGDIDWARDRVSMIVSRDTSALDESGITCATIESILENGNDAVFGALFWYSVGGAPLAVFYRLVNTLDAMWGYKNERYRDFGWAAARLDDLLNFLPARLTAFSYAFAGNRQLALKCWTEQARLWYSPNAGPVMAAGAGALNVKLGGDAVYGGVVKSRPQLGDGRNPEREDILRAIKLVKRTVTLWTLSSIVGGALRVNSWRKSKRS